MPLRLRRLRDIARARGTYTAATLPSARRTALVSDPRSSPAAPISMYLVLDPTISISHPIERCCILAEPTMPPSNDTCVCKKVYTRPANFARHRKKCTPYQESLREQRRLFQIAKATSKRTPAAQAAPDMELNPVDEVCLEYLKHLHLF